MGCRTIEASTAGGVATGVLAVPRSICTDLGSCAIATEFDFSHVMLLIVSLVVVTWL